jgi:DNA invertase Pin-like site-specific DNA recombinase
MPIAYSYSRYSSKAQAQGDSLRRQLASAYAYAEDHKLALNTELQDLGLSGYTGANRYKGALASFLARIEAGEIERGSYLLIDSVDRLSREKLLTATGLWLSIAGAGINIVNLSSGSVFNAEATAPDMILLVLEIERAHRESAEKGRKVAKAREHARSEAREGKKIWTRTAPAWLRWSDEIGGFEKIPEKVAVIQQMFDMVDSGMGVGAVALRLNNARVPTFGEGRKAKTGWREARIHQIITGKHVLGEYQPHTTARIDGGRVRKAAGEPIQGYYPKVIDEGQFWRVQEGLKSRSFGGRAQNLNEFSNLLIGQIRCRGCGCPVGIQRARRTDGMKVFLRCHTATKRGTCDHRARLPYAPLEAAIIQHVKEWKIPSSQPEPDSSGTEAAIIRGQITTLESKLENWSAALGAGSPSDAPKFLLAQMTKAEADIDAAKRQLREVEGTIKAKATDLSLSSRQDALRSLLEKMDEAEGEELYELRAAVSNAFRGVIQQIWFNGEPDTPGRQYTRSNGEIVNIGSIPGSQHLTIEMKADTSAYGFLPDGTAIIFGNSPSGGKQLTGIEYADRDQAFA